MEPEIIDLMGSDDEEGNHIKSVPIVPSNINSVPIGLSNINSVPFMPSAPRKFINNVEKSFLNSSTGIPEAEQLIAECSLCDGVFNSTAAFVNHMQSYHRLSNLFECTSCHQIFISQVGLKYHMDTVHPHLLATTSLPRSCLSCEICGDKFKFQEALDAHKVVHTVEKKYTVVAENLGNEKSSKNYTCSICLKKFFFKKALMLHRKKKHVVIRKTLLKSCPSTFTCDVCSKVYSCYRSLRSHRWWHFRNNPSTVDKSWINESLSGNLMSPANRLKGTDELRQTCDSKQSSGTTETSVSPKSNEIPCTLCKRVFPSNKSLARHKHWHLIKARKLEKARRLMESRKIKKSPIKKDSNEKLKISIQLFANNEAKIKNPISNDAHKIPSIERESDRSISDDPRISTGFPRAYECQYCHDKFVYVYNFRQHLEIHKTKKSLFCHICGEVFAYKCNLQSHEYIHHSSEVLTFCKFCVRPYTNQFLLNAHSRSCYQIFLKVKESLAENEKEQSNQNSTDVYIVPLNQSLPSSSNVVPPDLKEIHMSTNSTYLKIQPSSQYLEPVDAEGYYSCNICKKKYSIEVHLFRHVLLKHSSEIYPFDSSDILFVAPPSQDSPDLSNEDDFVNFRLNCPPAADGQDCSSQKQNFLNQEKPEGCSDPLCADPVIEQSGHQGTQSNEQNMYQNSTAFNSMLLDLSIYPEQVEGTETFSEYHLTANRRSPCPTSFNNNNSDLGFYSNQERVEY